MNLLIAFFLALNMQIESFYFVLKKQEALTFCKANNLNTDYCVLIDMSIHSGKKRFYLLSFKKDSIAYSALVFHGCGPLKWSDDESKENPIFSNTNDSHLASLGKYRIGNRGWSSWGININYKLHGLDSTNSNAYQRIIVLHGWDAVKDAEQYPHGSPEGYGCPAVSNNTMRYLDNKLKNKKKDVLMWIYK